MTQHLPSAAAVAATAAAGRERMWEEGTIKGSGSTRTPPPFDMHTMLQGVPALMPKDGQDLTNPSACPMSPEMANNSPNLSQPVPVPDRNVSHIPSRPLDGSHHAPRAAPAEADLRLLIVEDDDFVRTSFHMMLETVGEVRVAASDSDGYMPFAQLDPIAPQSRDTSRFRINVHFAKTGESGLLLLKSGAFDIAIIDVHLGGNVSGLDISWSYQKMLFSRTDDEIIPQTIAVACTSDTLTTQEKVERFGFHDLVKKPVSLPTLRHVLHKWMPRRETCMDRYLLPAALLGQRDSATPSDAAPSTTRILLVEDCEVTRSASDLVFRQLGLCIDTVSNGEAAIKRFEKHEYDLCLFDLNLPSMSGYALCSWYKEFCARTGTPVGYVVAVTADPDPPTCQQFGIDVCLPKPLSLQRVAEMLRYFKLTQSQTRKDHHSIAT